MKGQVAKEPKRQRNHGYLEKATEITEGCFTNPAVIPFKKDKIVRMALYPRKLSEVMKK